MSNSIKSVTVIYDPASDTSYVSFCYPEDTTDDTFILEYWDDLQRKWVPYDNKYGIVKRTK